MNKRMWEEFGRRMNEKEYASISEVNSVLAREGGDLGEHDSWQEDRGWINDDLRASIHGSKVLIRNIGG